MPNFEILADELRKAGYTVRAPAPPPPRHTCLVCGTTQEGEGWYPEPYMTDVTVVTAQGEEGYAHETRYVCLEDVCLQELTDALVKLGFGSHRHGGINFLEVTDCPGASKTSDCPTPEVDEDD